MILDLGIKPYYSTPRGDLYNADCLDILPLIPDKSVDLVVTSPPYNKSGYRGKRDTSTGKGRWSGSDIYYGEYADDLDETEYKQWQINILNECYKKLNDNRSCFYNHKIRRSNHKASNPFEWIIKTDLTFYQQIIWDRGCSVDHNIGYLDPSTELVFWLCKGTPIFNKDTRFSKEVWRLNPELGTEHPAPFPIELASIIIKMATKDTMIVVDPFGGSGTTAVACEDLNRRWICIEKEEKYCELSAKRIEQFLSQGKLDL